MGMYRDRARAVAAVLLVAAAILVAVGVSLERAKQADEHQQTTAVDQPQGGSGEHDESAEHAEGAAGEQAQHDEAAQDGAGSSTSGEERELAGEGLFGVSLESTGLLVAAVAVSLLLAILLLTLARREVLLAVLVVGLGFALLDIREGLHQASEARPGLFVIAVAAGVLHLGAAGFAAARAVGATPDDNHAVGPYRASIRPVCGPSADRPHT